jgi:phosphoglycolate phosphatase-like HAD superfamily hydrolase
MKQLLVLDFDGTLTNAEEEGRNYKKGYIEDIALLADLSIEETNRLADKFEKEIVSDADRFGWNFNGKIVAPASVDPYLRIMPISRMILDHVGAFTNTEERNRLLDRILYKYNYQKTTTAFRDGAAEFFASTSEVQGMETCIVTNSHTKPVQEKVRVLGERSDNDFNWLVDRVYGSARKYILDDSFQKVEESMHVPDLTRPIYLRRKLYYDRLADLQEKFDSNWENTIVLGDIFELDLCVPLACGANVALMTNEFTPQYEINFLKQHERGAVFSNLADALQWIKDQA